MDLAVEAILALIDAVHGPLRAPDTLRRHVLTILEAAREVDTNQVSGDRDEAQRVLLAYCGLRSLVD
jgi:hypothetical protein